MQEADALALVKNGCIAVAEGANMPCTKMAVEVLMKNKVLFAPGKAANAGGVTVSAFEMSQNSMRQSWSFEEVDRKLKANMESIFENIDTCAMTHNLENNFVAGANIFAFNRLVEGLLAQGVV